MSTSRKVLFALCALLLCSSMACASVTADPGGPPPVASAVDQLTGVWLTYEASPQTPDDQAAALTAALTLLGVDLDSLETVAPAGSGLVLASRVVAEHPDLAPFELLIARLWTLALYGAPGAPTATLAPDAMSWRPPCKERPVVTYRMPMSTGFSGPAQVHLTGPSHPAGRRPPGVRPAAGAFAPSPA